MKSEGGSARISATSTREVQSQEIGRVEICIKLSRKVGMCFIGNHTRLIRDFLEVPFPALEINKDKCPPARYLLLPFLSHPLTKLYCVHAPSCDCHCMLGLPVFCRIEVCLAEKLFLRTLSRSEESSPNRRTLARDPDLWISEPSLVPTVTSIFTVNTRLL